MITSNHHGKIAVAAALTLGISLGGCASAPPAQDKIAVATSSVQRAEQAGAQQSASVEMSSARDKLAQAEKAAEKRDAKIAYRMAEQADIDARVAEASANAAKSHQAVSELDRSLQSLREEALRSQSQPAP